MRTTRTSRGAVAAACLWAAVAAVHAGGFSVSPVRLHFAERDRAVALRLSNASEETLTMHAQVQAWSQDALGKDRLEPSDDLIVSPAVLRVAPRSEQVVRLVLTVPRNPARQMTYRLVLREQPRALPAPDAGTQVPIGLALSLPVFITPARARHALRCEPAEPVQGTAMAQCENTGLAHVHLTELELFAGTHSLGRHEGAVYLLAGTRRSLALRAAIGSETRVQPTPTSAYGWTLRARLDSDERLQWGPAESQLVSR